MMFVPPELHAPHLVDLLGRRVPDLTLVRIRRRPVVSEGVQDARAAASTALRAGLEEVRPRDTVAIGVGSRGIADLAAVVAGMIDAIRSVGGTPFIVPAMGSHGGSTAAGQKETLAGLGVTEEAVGAPVRATMETTSLGIAEDVDVAVDAEAAAADHILLVNRMKSHTSFSGEIESGLAKMLAIGLGKQHGAEEVHRRGPAELERRIRVAARHICARLPVRGGIGLVEGIDKRLIRVELVAASGIAEEQEAALLTLAKGHEARLPFAAADVLVVDTMGKQYSGTGMDTNVLGRRMVRGMPELSRPRISHVVCLSVSPGSHGNAVGIGLADFIPHAALAGIDLAATYANTLTAGSQAVQRAQIPIVLADEVDAVSAAILTADLDDVSRVRLARIHNTLNLDEMWVTEALVAEASEQYEVVGEGTLFGPSRSLPTW